MGGGGGVPRGAVAEGAQRASEAARAAFSDVQGPNVPCATCPPASTPELELDGALIGRGCQPLTNPRARGRLKPRQEVVAFADTGMGGQVPVFGDRPEDVGVKREALTRAEVRNAFQPGNLVHADSHCCRKVRTRRGPRTVVYTNGINTDLKTHCETLRKIAAATCADVLGVYNATEGMTSDLTQVATDRSLIKEAASGKPFAVGDRRNPAVDTLSDLVFIGQRSPQDVGGRMPQLWAHSQGGAITSLSLYDAKLRLQRAGYPGFDDLDVTSFNSAAPRWVDGPDYTHFVHQGDFVGMRTGVGADHGNPAVVGAGATVVEFSDLKVRDAEARYAWREVHDGVATERGFGTLATGPSAWNPATTAHHGIDDRGLGMYRQRQIAEGGSICPEPPAPPAAQPAARSAR